MKWSFFAFCLLFPLVSSAQDEAYKNERQHAIRRSGDDYLGISGQVDSENGTRYVIENGRTASDFLALGSKLNVISLPDVSTLVVMPGMFGKLYIGRQRLVGFIEGEFNTGAGFSSQEDSYFAIEPALSVGLSFYCSDVVVIEFVARYYERLQLSSESGSIGGGTFGPRLLFNVF